MAELPEDLVPAAARNVSIEVENTRDARHGDFASNLAMRLAKATRQNPRKLAETLMRLLPASPAIAKVDIAGAGFINFHLSKDGLSRRNRQGAARRPALRTIARRRGAIGAGGIRVGESDGALACRPRPARCLRRVRRPICWRPWAIAWSASTTSTIRAARWTSSRSAPGCAILEYCGERFTFPANGYRGDYIAAIGERLFAARGPRCAAACRARCSQDLPPDEPQGGDKDVVHRCADRARPDR